jgi:hypothetical protein
MTDESDRIGENDRVAELARTAAGYVAMSKDERDSFDARLNAGRGRFDFCVEEARMLLRAVPFRAPSDPALAEAWRQRVNQARHLSQRPKKWRPALAALADRVRRIAPEDWTIKCAMQVEADAAILAFWIAQGSGVLIVRQGTPLPQQAVAEWIDRAASEMKGKAGNPGVSDANLDAAIVMLLHAFGVATGRQGRELLRTSLREQKGREGQVDAGPSARFVREVVAVLAPDLAAVLGPQAVFAAIRRRRNSGIE